MSARYNYIYIFLGNGIPTGGSGSDRIVAGTPRNFGAVTLFDRGKFSMDDETSLLLKYEKNDAEILYSNIENCYVCTL